MGTAWFQGLVLSGVLAAGVAAMAREVPGVVVTPVRSTGQTVGHVADATVVNRSRETCTCILGPALIPGTKVTHGYLITDPVAVRVEAGKSMVVPLHGYPLDTRGSAVPQDELLPAFAKWVFPNPQDNPTTPDDFLEERPHFRSLSRKDASRRPLVIAFPGSGEEFDYKIDINQYPAEAVWIVCAAMNRIRNAYDVLAADPEFRSPYPRRSAAERQNVIRYTFLLYVDVLQNIPFFKPRLQQLLRDDLPFAQFSPAVNQKLTKKTESLWDAIVQVGTKAGLFVPASSSVATTRAAAPAPVRLEPPIPWDGATLKSATTTETLRVPALDVPRQPAGDSVAVLTPVTVPDRDDESLLPPITPPEVQSLTIPSVSVAKPVPAERRTVTARKPEVSRPGRLSPLYEGEEAGGLLLAQTPVAPDPVVRPPDGPRPGSTDRPFRRKLGDQLKQRNGGRLLFKEGADSIELKSDSIELRLNGTRYIEKYGTPVDSTFCDLPENQIWNSIGGPSTTGAGTRILLFVSPADSPDCQPRSYLFAVAGRWDGRLRFRQDYLVLVGIDPRTGAYRLNASDWSQVVGTPADPPQKPAEIARGFELDRDLAATSQASHLRWGPWWDTMLRALLQLTEWQYRNQQRPLSKTDMLSLRDALSRWDLRASALPTGNGADPALDQAWGDFQDSLRPNPTDQEMTVTLLRLLEVQFLAQSSREQ